MTPRTPTWPRTLGWLYCAGLLAFLLFPLAIIVPASFGASDTLEFPPGRLSLRWYSQVLGDARWLGSALLSLEVAAGAAMLATLAALSVALAHLRFGAAPRWLRAGLMLPAVAPHIVLATGLFLLLLQANLLGNPALLAIGHACLAVPVGVIILTNAVETIDPLLWGAAASLGARRGTILRHVVLPNIVPGLVAAVLLAFISSWDEVTFAVFIGPMAPPMLSSRMFSYLQELISPAITAIATLLLLTTLVVAGLGMLLPRMVRRRPGGPAA